MSPLRLVALLAGGLALAPATGLADSAPIAIPAVAAGSGATLARLTGAYAAVRTLTADFTQETRFAGFQTPRTYGGRMDLARPDRMRWDYTQGSAQQVYVDGRTVTVYAPEAAQAIVSTLTPASDAQVPLHLLADVTRVEETYDVAAGTDLGSLVLTPKNAVAGGPERVTLWLDPDSGLIARVRLELPGGSTSDIRFSGVAVNPPVDPGRFAFTPPEGTHLIQAADLLPRAPSRAAP
jgi:outer membrane lipoprotein-sorting protein